MDREKLEKRLEHAKALADTCYTRMYDCSRHELKDYKDDALLHLAEAERWAVELGLAEEAEALRKKSDHVMAVYWQMNI